MAQAHDHPCAIGFMRFRADLQLCGQAFFRHDQRMIAGRRHRLWRVLEERFAVMLNTAGFSVHQLVRTDNVPAKSRANRLMSKAYAQHRRLPAKCLIRSMLIPAF